MAELPTTPFVEHPAAGTNKRLSVERIYQRKTQLEHILLRPDTYVGSVEETTETMWVFDSEKEAIVKKQITFVPGLYKIFDEILVNAADNKQRDKSMNSIKITIDAENNLISVWNNGCGIPVEVHATEKMYVPELIFGTLLTSSNYDDDQKKVTGGRNGYGAKLCNIFSTEFTVETGYKQTGKTFKMTWKDNMGKAGKTIIKDGKTDFTKVTFKPDLAKFKMTHLTADMVALMTRRAYDMAGCTKGVAVYLNGVKLPIKSFRDYVDLFLKAIPPSEDEEDLPQKVVYEVVNPRWEVAVTVSPAGFQQASFVNSIATTKGGTHVNYITDQVVSKLLENAKRKNKGGMDLKPFHIKNHLWVFISCQVENPCFDSQTKENLTLKAKNFGSTCPLTDKFIKQAINCGIVDRVLTWARAKSQAVISKKQSGSKHTKLRGIPKLDDANDAGSKNSLGCTLIVTEGDSAKTLAVSGLGVVGRDHYGVFPLRGKLLNTREATHNQIMGNEEITNMVKILGLNYSKKYVDSAELRTLRYGKLMIMADQDQDGSHIKGLVINFIHHNWPNLLKHNFVEEFITPIVKVTRGNQEHSFYSLPEFERWKADTENQHLWKVKYYKGLGTSTSKEAKEYFSDMDRHRIPFHYEGPGDDDAILLAFSKKKIEQRKEWLTNWLENRKEKRAAGLNESFLYAAQTDTISYADFVNKELILFSNMDNERSIPSIVDGLKPGQRKVLYTCFKRNDKRDIKVAQLAGSVAEHSAYHHGEASLMSTIVGLAQNFVGSNNVNILQPLGQFGTRLHGGKDAASPRYIFTMLSSLTRLLFPSTDDTQLTFLFEDNLKIEPEWYCPIVPLVLMNGSEGIGTGYSTSVPNFNPREIVANIKRMLNGMEPVDMQPWYKNFTGQIAHVEPSKYIVYGTISRLSSTTLEITELPVRSWTQAYKENVLEVMLHGNDKTQPFITDYKEYHTDTTVKFVVTMTAEKLSEAETVGFHKKFKLESNINISNLVMFDHTGCLKRYSGAVEILKEFFDVRLDLYRKRKEYLEGQLTAEAAKLTNQARFIVEKIEGKVVVENKRKSEMIDALKIAGYRSDPVKAWKASNSSEDEGAKSQDEEEESGEEQGPDFNYLLSMSMWSLTREKKEELLKNRDAKVEELRLLKEKTHKDLWTDDLEAFLSELDKVEATERKEMESGATISIKRSKKSKGKSGGRQTTLSASNKNSLGVTKPSPFAEAIQPKIPEFNAEPKAPKVRVKKEPKATKPPKQTVRGKKAAAKVSDESKLSEKSVSEKAKDFGFGDSDNEETMSLAERIAKNSKKGDGKQKQTKLKFEVVSTKEADDSLSDDEEVMNFEVDTPPAPIQREKRAIKRKTYADNDDSDVIFEEFDSEDDFQTPKKIVRQNITKSKSSESLSPGTKKPKGTKSTVRAKETKENTKKLMAKKPRLVLKKSSASPLKSDIDDESDSIIVNKPGKTLRPADLDSTDDEASQPPAKKQAVEKPKRKASKPAVFDVDVSDDDFAPDEVSQPPAKKQAVEKPKRKASKPTVFDADVSDDDFAPAPAPAKKQALKKPKASKPVKKAAAAAKPKKTQAKKDQSQKTLFDLGMKKGAAKKSRTGPTLDELLKDGSESEDEVVPLSERIIKPVPSKAAAKSKAKPPPRPKKVTIPSDDSDEEVVPKAVANPKAKAAPRRKKVTTLSDGSEEEGEKAVVSPTPAARPTRNRKNQVVNYVIDSDEESIGQPTRNRKKQAVNYIADSDEESNIMMSDDDDDDDDM